MKTTTKKIVQHDYCDGCIFLKFEEFIPKKGFQFPKAFFHCTKTDLYVRGFFSYQTKMNNDEQLEKLFQYCPLEPHEREFLEFHVEIDNEGD